MSNSLPLVSIRGGCLISNGQTLLKDIDIEIHGGQIWQIHGAKGSGKSLLLDLLLGRHRLASGARSYPAFATESSDAELGFPPRFALRLVSQQEQRRVASDQACFYQARWHSLWVESLSVEQFLSPTRVMGIRPYEIFVDLPVRPDFDSERGRYLAEMDLAKHREQLVGQLSNGELCKLLLVAAHLASPKIMLLDDPPLGTRSGARDVSRLLVAFRAMVPIATARHNAPSFQLRPRCAYPALALSSQ